MPNATTINLTNGVPTGPVGAATVSSLDNLIGTAGAPSANVQSVQGVPGGTAITTSDGGTAGSGIVPPSGGSGLSGWLSGIYNALVSALPVIATASAGSGGVASTYRLLSAAATTNPTSVKASAGRVYQVLGYNAAPALRYLKLYNKASAPTVGTDTPVKTIALPPQSAFAIDNADLGRSFSSGIAFALTVNVADSDATALAAGDILALNMDYA